MGFGMFSVHHSPIAIDFGSASIKLLQVGSGTRPPLLAAAELPIPDSIRAEPDRVMSYAAEWLPVALRDGKFKGRRVVIAVPALQTFTQHMQIIESEGFNRDEMIKAQLQTQIGCPPHGVVVRSIEVCNVHRNGQAQKEMICFAITKEVVMRYVDLLSKCKLEVVGVHTDVLAMVRAFDHIHRREEDANITTLYIDLGWGGTRVGITHGKQLAFARHIPIGGRHFDQLIANTIHCDMPSARAHRLTLTSPHPVADPDAEPLTADDRSDKPDRRNELSGVFAKMSATVFKSAATTEVDRRTGRLAPSIKQSIEPAEGHRKAVNVDLTELLDTITDELSMCLRYHQSLFRERPINRAIFVGGESRQAWLCQHIVKALRVPAQMGDPLARHDASQTPPTPGLKLGNGAQPGWAAACGLCSAQIDS